MNLKFTSKTVLTHIFFFCFFLILPSLVFERLPDESLFTVTRVIVQDSIANVILLCFFYLNYYVLIPKFYFERKYVLYVLMVLLFLGITLPLPHIIGNFFYHNNTPHFPLHQPNNLPPPGNLHNDYFQPKPSTNSPLFSFSLDELRRHLYLFFTAVFFSFLLRTREHLSQVKEDKLNAELTSLKAQINPHFLFNTLNSIYALSVKKDDKASDAIIHLSGLMRYVIKDVNDDEIPLNKEIEYITNYIELQKARLGNTTKVLFDVIGGAGNKKITPLILITYIENAFKYGVNPDVDDCIVEVKMNVTKSGLNLYVSNKKVPNINLAESTGIGLKNTNERLKYLYPKKHNLEIYEDDKTYSVMLSIKLI